MKILSFHAFSLYGNGGGNRILRRLYEGRETDVTTLIVEASPVKPHTGAIKEVVVYATPLIQPWARWKLRNLLTWLRTRVLKSNTISKIRKTASAIHYDVLHIINHGGFSAALCTDQFCEGKELWVSFHDHYNEIKSLRADTQMLWNRAGRRLVISKQLGDRYQQEFGAFAYELITDGVTDDELSAPAPYINTPVNIYFAGLLHMRYVPLFEALAGALDTLSERGYQFNLVLRGTQNLKFLQNRSFGIAYRPVTVNGAELKQELDAADILYLPIKFSSPDFYFYSLSTKMVGYLTAPGTILYHGPGDSAACKLLRQSGSAMCSTSLNANELVKDLTAVLKGGNSFSEKAKQLAREQFMLDAIQKRFWRS